MGFYIMTVVFFVTHAAEFDMTLPLDVVEKYAPDPIFGAFGDGGEGDDEEDDPSEGGCTMEEVVLINPVWCSFCIMAVVIVITHATEFDIIHPPDVVEKYAPDADIGALGEEGDDEEDDSSEGGCTMEEVAKYNKKGDVWVVLNGSALRISNFWSLHPGGELTILTFAGNNRVRHNPPSWEADTVRCMSWLRKLLSPVTRAVDSTRKGAITESTEPANGSEEKKNLSTY